MPQNQCVPFERPFVSCFFGHFLNKVMFQAPHQLMDVNALKPARCLVTTDCMLCTSTAAVQMRRFCSVKKLPRVRIPAIPNHQAPSSRRFLNCQVCLPSPEFLAGRRQEHPLPACLLPSPPLRIWDDGVCMTCSRQQICIIYI